MNIKEISLQKALNASACKELPRTFTEKDEEDNYWIKAIALVKKRDMTQSYCLAERNSDGLIRYTADFGNLAGIFGLISVHPYVAIDLKRFGFEGSDAEFKEFMKRKLRLSDEDMAANSEEDWRRARIEYAKRQQEESDERFQRTGVAEIVEEEMMPEVEKIEKADGVIKMGVDTVETLTIVSESKAKAPYKKAGRPRKNK